MQFRSALTVIVFAAGMSACGSKDLAKEQAKSLISDNFDKNPVTQPILTGMASTGTATEEQYFNSPDGRFQKNLEADGLIAVVAKGKIFRPGQTGSKREYFNALDISLTDKGRKYITGKPNVVPAKSDNTWPTVYENAAFCSREVVDIATITTNDDFARADYTFKLGKLTPFGVQYQKTDPTDKNTCNTTTVQNASATFERQGDVWKLTTAQ